MKYFQKCQFCRSQHPPDAVASLESLVKRDNSNGDAMSQLASLYAFNGGDQKRIIELYHVAARMNSVMACYRIGALYWEGMSFDDIIFQKDRDKAMRLFSKGARLGDPECLFCLGVMHYEDGNDDYVQYSLKAASAGYRTALDAVKKGYMDKIITKDEYANALRSFQVVHDEISSKERTAFNKRLGADQTYEYFREMNAERQVEVLKKVLGIDVDGPHA